MKAASSVIVDRAMQSAMRQAISELPHDELVFYAQGGWVLSSSPAAYALLDKIFEPGACDRLVDICERIEARARAVIAENRRAAEAN